MYLGRLYPDLYNGWYSNLSRLRVGSYYCSSSSDSNHTRYIDLATFPVRLTVFSICPMTRWLALYREILLILHPSMSKHLNGKVLCGFESSNGSVRLCGVLKTVLNSATHLVVFFTPMLAHAKYIHMGLGSFSGMHPLAVWRSCSFFFLAARGRSTLLTSPTG